MSHNDSTDTTTTTATAPKKRKQLILTLFAAVLLVAPVIGVAGEVNSRNHRHSKKLEASTAAAHHAIIKTSCSATLYPELCFTTLTTHPLVTEKVPKTQKHVIELAINISITTVEHNYLAVKNLIARRKDLTVREKTALNDCLETIGETLDELDQAQEDLEKYPNAKSLKQHADDLKTLLSSAITNQDTCLDGFSYDEADKKVGQVLLRDELHLEKLCSNALAMIKNMTDTDIANEMKPTAGRRLKEEVEEAGEEDKIRWPGWLSAGDRRLLQSSSVTPNVVVAADGSGNYRTVAAAVAAAPVKSSKRYVIRIKAGVYRENVEVPKNKHNIMFVGDGRTTTIITGSRNVADGSTTFHSATVGEF